METSLAASLEKLEKPAEFKPTDEQLAILDAVKSDHQVIVVEAGAGAGKTSSLKLVGETLPGIGQYTAFNKSLVMESKEKFQGTRVSCDTTHSLAFRAVGKNYAHRLNKGRIRSWQVAKILGISEIKLQLTEEVAKTLSPDYLAWQVMAAVKTFCQSADEAITHKHFPYINGIDIPDEQGKRTYTNNDKVKERLLTKAWDYWFDIAKEDGQLPFTHDHYVKLWQLSKPVIAGDFILLDESQDTAEVMLDVIRQQTCKVVLVGDSAQQIYQWRGAVNAMASFPDAPRCYLSQSFRFGQEIANVANLVLETLEEPTPLRLRGFDKIDSKVCEVAEPTAILCRTNAVAVTHLLGAIAAGRKPFLMGGSAEVIAFIEAALQLQQGSPTAHPELACFESWQEVQKYVKEDEGSDLKLMVTIIDKFGCQVILDALRNMPEEKDADLVISTAHKSKGRQWKKVKLAVDFPTVSKSRDADKRLVYVALTRAQEELDVTECPFFTGRDAIDLDRIVPVTTNAIAPTATVPVKKGKFTWCKWEGVWMVRGPSGCVGQRVEVERKSGEVSNRTLRSIVREFQDATVYKVD